MRILISSTVILMNLWPWIYFGGLSTTGGVLLSAKLAVYAVGYPQPLHSLITFIGTLNRTDVAYPFGCAIQRLRKHLIAHRSLSIFKVIVLLGFKNLVYAYFVVGTSVLLTPDNFRKTVLLQGSELNFLSEDTSCLQRLEAHRKSNVCGQELRSPVLPDESTVYLSTIK